MCPWNNFLLIYLHFAHHFKIFGSHQNVFHENLHCRMIRLFFLDAQDQWQLVLKCLKYKNTSEIGIQFFKIFTLNSSGVRNNASLWNRQMEKAKMIALSFRAILQRMIRWYCWKWAKLHSTYKAQYRLIEFFDI